MYRSHTEVNPVAVAGSIPAAARTLTAAACAGDTSIDWIPAFEPDQVPDAVARLCGSCPARNACLAWATVWDAQGFWAGTTTAQRRGSARAPQDPTHEGPGSIYRYQQGCRCRDCKDAQRDRMRRRRART